MNFFETIGLLLIGTGIGVLLLLGIVVFITRMTDE